MTTTQTPDLSKQGVPYNWISPPYGEPRFTECLRRMDEDGIWWRYDHDARQVWVDPAPGLYPQGKVPKIVQNAVLQAVEAGMPVPISNWPSNELCEGPECHNPATVEMADGLRLCGDCLDAADVEQADDSSGTEGGERRG